MDELKTTTFDVIFEAEGRNVTKFRNDVTVHMRGSAPRSDFLPTDEGAMHGGDGTAPYPLAYFTSALAACVMTQIRAFSKRLHIPVGEFSVNCRCHWQAQQTGSEPYVSKPGTFVIDVDLKESAPRHEQQRLMAAVEKGCFIEASLRPGLVKHRLFIDGAWEDV